MRYVLKSNDKNSFFLKSLFWGVLAGVMNQGLTFITNVLNARILKYNLGELTLYTTSNSFLQTFALLGLTACVLAIVSKNLKNPQENAKVISSIYLILAMSVASILILSISIELFVHSQYKIWNVDSNWKLIPLVFWFIASSIDQVQVAILFGYKAFKDIAKVSLLKGIITLIIITSLAYKWGVIGCLWGYTFSFTISLLCNYWYINRKNQEYGVSLSFCSLSETVKIILKKSLPLFGAGAVLTPAIWYSNHFLYNVENGTILLSLFAISYQWLVLIQFFPSQISKIVMPFVASLKSSERAIEKKGLKLSMGIVFLLVIFSLVFARIIIENLYHFDFSKASFGFYIMCLTGIFATHGTYVGQVMIGKGCVKYRTVADIIMGLTLVITFRFLVITHPQIALPIAYFFAYLLADLYLVLNMKKV